MSHALLIDSVSKHYANHTAVRDLSLTVPTGSIYGILGPNGAGKSTTLRMVMNIIARDGGRIEVLGRAPEANGTHRRVGYLPEERGLYRRMNVMDVLLFFGRLKGLDRNTARAAGELWLDRMGLTEWRTSRVDTLSKGMQQKVQFITTVMHAPELLILDEPQSGLDPVNQEVLRETILNTRAEGGTVVLSTHNMDQAETLCDAVCIIAGGQKVLDGGLAEIKRRYRGDRYRLVLDGESLTSGELERAERVIRSMARHSEAERTGAWTLELGAASSAALLAAIADVGAGIDRFERISPTLHEIFIERVGAAARTPHREVVNA
jgi:ABC-2 type transport system ATP-binding protein